MDDVVFKRRMEVGTQALKNFYTTFDQAVYDRQYFLLVPNKDHIDVHFYFNRYDEYADFIQSIPYDFNEFTLDDAMYNWIFHIHDKINLSKGVHDICEYKFIDTLPDYYLWYLTFYLSEKRSFYKDVKNALKPFLIEKDIKKVYIDKAILSEKSKKWVAEDNHDHRQTYYDLVLETDIPTEYMKTIILTKLNSSKKSVDPKLINFFTNNLRCAPKESSING